MNTVTQCHKCPWRTSCRPERDIPDGYSVERHEALRETIAEGVASIGPVLRVMACHHSKPGEEFACAGWLHNQIETGNIAVRIAVSREHLPVPLIRGRQHARFEDTLPNSGRA